MSSFHSNRNYNDPDPKVNEAQAIKDLKQWFGIRQFNKCCRDVENLTTPISREQFRFIVSIGGVEGYPVEIWADMLKIPKDPISTEERANEKETGSS